MSPVLKPLTYTILNVCYIVSDFPARLPPIQVLTLISPAELISTIKKKKKKGWQCLAPFLKWSLKFAKDVLFLSRSFQHLSRDKLK